MVTFDQLVKVVQEDLDRAAPETWSTDPVADAVRATIYGLGFHIKESTGEICDPRPRPVMVFSNDPPRRRR